MAIIIDGRAMAARLLSSVASEVSELRTRLALHPTLAVVLIGEDPASHIYVRNKLRACKSVGIASREHRLPAATTQHELMALVETFVHRLAHKLIGCADRERAQSRLALALQANVVCSTDKRVEV